MVSNKIEQVQLTIYTPFRTYSLNLYLVMKTNQKFLLIAPWDYQLYVVIEKNLRYLGYEVTVIHNNHYPPGSLRLRSKLKYIVRTLFVGSRENDSNLPTTYSEEKRMSLLKSSAHYDICLVIRADAFSEKLLREAKKRSGKFISFFYDGLTFNQHLLPLIPLFDRFYIFDKTELQPFEKYNVYYAPNFYVDYPELEKHVVNKDTKLYYISSYNSCRLDTIQSFYKCISQRLSPVQFVLVYNKANEGEIPQYIKQHFTCRETIVSFEEQLHLIQHTELIVDIKMTSHSGFSFRIFYGIKLRKKVVTTNPLVVNEDFYHPDNFFVLTERNENELDDFLKRPYVPLDEKIRTKYSFESWLRAVIAY